jgi:hypothetical protein
MSVGPTTMFAQECLMTFTIYGPSLRPSRALANRVADDARYHPDPQQRIETYDNAAFFPDTHCLYDDDGTRISASRLWRNRRLDNDVWPVGQQAREVAGIRRVYGAPLIYLGVIFPHYGHFLLECIARLWALDRFDDPHVKLLYSESYRGAASSEFVTAFMAAVGLPADRLITFKEPVRLARVHIPHPSFYLKHEAYANHATLPMRAAWHMLAGRSEESGRDTPAYVSRTQFKAEVMANSRRVLNEQPLEDELRQNGVAIYYPEQMTLEQQVAMVNRHRWIIGTRGSAFHTLLFGLHGAEHRTCMLYEHGDPGTLVNYYLVDQMKGISGNYLGALRRMPGTVRPDGADYEIDIDLALDWLRLQGVLPGSPRRPIADNPGSLIRAHIAFQGDVDGGEDMAIGERGSGHWIEGFELEVPGFPLQYRALDAEGNWTAWLDSGSFVGTRRKSQPLCGFAIRLTGQPAATHTCRYTGRFGPTGQTATAADGDDCREASHAPLETMELFIAPRTAR